MITCDKGRTRIKGDLSTIQAEMAMIIRGVREILKGEYGKRKSGRENTKISQGF